MRRGGQLAERAVLARERDRTPLMLLDDVMSELDPERRELLARELSGGGQSVMRDAATSVNSGASDPRKDGAAVPQPLSAPD